MDDQFDITQVEGVSATPIAPFFGEELSAPLFSPRVLVADDDEHARKILVESLARRGLQWEVAGSITETAQLVQNGGIDILILDPDLKGGSVFGLLDQQLSQDDEVVIILASRATETDAALQRWRGRVQGFITKPFSASQLEQYLDVAIDRWCSRMRARHYQLRVETLVGTLTDRLLATDRLIESVYDEAVQALGAALNLRDSETEEHCRRVALNSVELARRVGYPTSGLKHLHWGAYLHDIGKIGLPGSILDKSGPLSESEQEIMRLHPLLGFRMVSNIGFLRGSTNVILYHHERFEGNGYIHELRGKQIPLAARIFSIVDAADAMLYDRPYREAMSYIDMIEALKQESGKQFDPEILSAFLAVPEPTWRKAEEPTQQLNR